MEAVEFLTIVGRICKDNYCADCADKCPIRFFCFNSYDNQTKENLEKAVEVVGEWAKAHSKTRQTIFLKTFPNAATVYGTIDILPCKLDKSLAEGCDGGEFGACAECKEAYWNEEVE